ncbi:MULTISPECIES: hypothetical protein [unclassified Sphingobium]|uniref:hypothetical protein n=1 Tax=unclassified Sphingobium TaxID=2611147 RepID=UPI0011A4ED0C|nr:MULTISPECIES: hypothetical protein [unclassified Sphingobium]MBG6116598.1 hypothetical protein [Sphingobium sp. JAI105]
MSNHPMSQKRSDKYTPFDGMTAIPAPAPAPMARNQVDGVRKVERFMDRLGMVQKGGFLCPKTG